MPAFITAGLKRTASPLLNAQFSIILFHQSRDFFSYPCVSSSSSSSVRCESECSCVESHYPRLENFLRITRRKPALEHRHRSQTRSNSVPRRIISNFRVKPRIRRKERRGRRKSEGSAYFRARSRAVILKMRLT